LFPFYIFLTGPMGAGKSTIGKRVAAHLHLPFIDTDKLIEEAAQAKIPDIFQREGEAGFRERETECLRALLLKAEPAVVATGGGIIERAENRELLSGAGLVVYLRTFPEQSYARVKRDTNRPLLLTDNPLEKLRELFKRRDPLYSALADTIIETGDLSAAVCAHKIVEFYSQRGS
jgi:shikimate kinase